MQTPHPVDAAPIRIGVLSNSFAALPETFHARLAPTPVSEPRVLRFNAPLAAELGLETADLDPAVLAAVFSGSRLPSGADPVAMAYAGHQFGNFVPRLGDGRAILIAEIVDRAGVRRDLHLKGAGRTPFSRGGDGRAALGPVLREYAVSEAMHALRIPTTRALAAVATGERVMREQMLPGAVLTRVATSHVRIGTFEFHAARGDDDALRQLADYVISRHYPDLAGATNPYLALLAVVAERQAELITEWMRVGFIHGVMNTDNMSVVGETIDFGPCAFMDAWDPSAVYSAIDRGGRYAFANQPWIAQWNLARFAETLLPLLASDPERAATAANEVLGSFMTDFARRRLAGLRAKLGLLQDMDGDQALIDALLDTLQAQGVDHTLFFWRLADAAQNRPEGVRALFQTPGSFDAWALAWQARRHREGTSLADQRLAMTAANPAIIPRNHQVELALRAAIDQDDLAPFHALVNALAAPYAPSAAEGPYAAPPRPEQRVLQTFCGT